MANVLVNSENLTKKAEVHLMPCKIMFTGKADVKSFFSSSILSSSSVKNESSEHQEGGFSNSAKTNNSFNF